MSRIKQNMVAENVAEIPAGIHGLAERVAYRYAAIERQNRFRFLFDPLRMLEQTDFIQRYLAGENSFPPSVELDPSNACNHDCGFCIYHSMHQKDRSERLSRDKLIPIIMVRDCVQGAAFAAGDICVQKTLPDRRFDAVTMLTLHSRFDDIDSWLDDLLELVQPGGRALIFGPFNPNGVDVLVRLGKSGDSDGCRDGTCIRGRHSRLRLKRERCGGNCGSMCQTDSRSPMMLILCALAWQTSTTRWFC